MSVQSVSLTSRLTEAGRRLCAAIGPMMRPATQADRDGLLIKQHFEYADAMGVTRERAMEIMREELWKPGRPAVADRVRAATERLGREEP